MILICTLLTIVVIKNLEVHQINIVMEFFNRDLEEETYMNPFEGYVLKSEEFMVCNLSKILYGLK